MKRWVLIGAAVLALLFAWLAGAALDQRIINLDRETTLLRTINAWECGRIGYLTREVNRNSYSNFLTGSALLKLHGQSIFPEIYHARGVLAYLPHIHCLPYLTHPHAKFIPPRPLRFDELKHSEILRLLGSPFR